MKDKRIIFFVLGCAIGVASIWAMVQSQQTEKQAGQVQQETYVSKVIIQAPWGAKNLVYDKEESKLGEFGFYQYQVPESLKMVVDAGLPEGPSAFTVAPNGDIYITDPLNYRVQRFSPEGQFISVIPKIVAPEWAWRVTCADQANNLYILWWNEQQVVHKYDQAGNLLKTYPLFKEYRGGGSRSRIFCDNLGRLFFQFPRVPTKVKDEISGVVTFQFGTTDQVFNSEQQKASLMKGGMGANGLSELRLYAVASTPGFFLQYDSLGNIIKQFSKAIEEGSFIGADEKGAIYMYGFDRNSKTSFVRKYDQQDNLICRMEWTQDRAEWWGPTVRGSSMMVDKNGNVYEYFSTKQGITITKWYKQ